MQITPKITPKVALCFILNYEHVLVKETLWRKWIEPNADIINVYFFYQNAAKIKSDWVRERMIPQAYCAETSYLFVLPAYIALMRYALRADGGANEWAVFLTDFCAPITTPRRFRQLFFEHHAHTFMNWRPCWWNVEKQHRANLKLLPEQFHLANSPWFTMTRAHIEIVLQFIHENPTMAKMVFDGVVANESFFAIALEKYGVLKGSSSVLRMDSHIADWGRMSSATSPHIFSRGDHSDRHFIDDTISANPYVMFLRKVAPELPDAFIEKYIDNGANSAAPYTPWKFYLPLWAFRRLHLITPLLVARIITIIVGIWIGYVVFI